MFCAVFGLSCSRVCAQLDSAAFAHQYFVSAEGGVLGKNRSMGDSFAYSITRWTMDAGIQWRGNKVLRPFLSLGLVVGNHNISNRYDSSSFASLKPGRATSLAVQPKIGFEVKPNERWYFRLALSSPAVLGFRETSKTALAEAVGIYYNQRWRIQRRDLLFGVEVGRTVWEQRLDLKLEINVGMRPAFTFPTPDASRLIGWNLGVRYHFDR